MEQLLNFSLLQTAVVSVLFVGRHLKIKIGDPMIIWETLHMMYAPVDMSMDMMILVNHLTKIAGSNIAIVG